MMKHPIQKTAVIVCVLAVLVVGYVERGVIRDTWAAWHTPALPVAQTHAQAAAAQPPLTPPSKGGDSTNVSVQGETSVPASGVGVVSASSSLPASVNLAVPFTSQAPLGVWDAYHEETCEEASLVMVNAFYKNQPPGVMDGATVETMLHAITDWEDKTFGLDADTTAAQTGQIATEFLGYKNVKVIANPSLTDLKQFLAKGFPVIVPAAGKLLNNPYFTAPGPTYHMLVLRGYTQNGFITNDPGTHHGQAMVYPFDTILNAMHDWNGTNDITLGAKVVLVVYPN